MTKFKCGLTVHSAEPWHCMTESGTLACSLGHHSSIGGGTSWINPNAFKLLGQDIDLQTPSPQTKDK